MKCLIVLACVASLAAAGVMDQDWTLGKGRNSHIDRMGRDSLTHEDLLRQKFLLDVLQHVNQPLRNEELLSLATTLIVDDSKYIGNIDGEMLRVIELCRQHRLLGKNTICTVTEDEHLRQMIGLYRLLERSGDWDTFQRNACYMRQHVNGALFVNALLLAVRDRADTQRLIVPAIHEILPELYMDDDDLLMQVDKIDLSHLIGATETRNPHLMDLVGLGGRIGSLTMGRGRIGLNRIHLWMPWRELHREMTIQRMGVGKPSVHISSEDKIVLPVKSRRTDIGLLTEDVGLKSWLHILISDLCLTEGEILGRSTADGAVHRGIGSVDRNRMDMHDDDITHSQWNDRAPDYRRVKLGGHHMDGVGGVRLDETLPTTDIHSDRLLHVNRRRWNTNHAQTIEGFRQIVDTEDDMNLDDSRDGRSTLHRDGRILENNRRSWKVDSDRGMHVREDHEIPTLPRDMPVIGKDRWHSRPDDIHGSLRNHHAIDWHVMDNTLMGDSNMGIGRVQNMNVDMVEDDVSGGRMWRDNQRNRMVMNRHSGIGDGRMVDEDHWWNVRGGISENSRHMDAVNMHSGRTNIHDKDRKIWRTSRGMGDIGTDRPNRLTVNTRMMDNVLVGDSNMGARSTHRRIARSVHLREDVDMDRLNVHLRETGIAVLHNLQQIIARINIERIALGLTDTAVRSQRLNNARLGVGERMALRLNEMRLDTRINRNLIEKINDIEQRLATVIQREVRRIAGTHQLGDIRSQRDVNRVIGEILVGNVDGVGIMQIIREILMETQEIHGMQTLAHVGVLPLNEPLVLHVLSRLVRIIDQCRQEHLGAVPLEAIRMNGLTIDDVKVDQLRTHIDLSDSDLINLMDPRLILSADRTQKVVVGRQQRLNHKEFDIDVDITADRSRRVLMRTLLVPRLDGVGRSLGVEEQRLNALLLDTTVLDLQAGRNHIKRTSTNFMWTTRDTTPLTEIYKAVMMALDGKIDFADVRDDLVGQDCRFPHRLLLPRGTATGLNMQLVIVVTPIEGSSQTIRSDHGVRGDLLCLMGVGTNTIDELPLMFPLDRRIESIESLMDVPNVHVLDVVIRHEDKVIIGQRHAGV